MLSTKKILKESSKLITPAIFDKVYDYSLESGMYEALKDFIFPQKEGKRLRPAITLWTVKAYNKISMKNGRFPAFSIEVDHNRYLVHDDIEDNSKERRGQPCLYLKYGIDKGINFGDRLEAIAQRALEVEYEKGFVSLKDFYRLSKERREQVQTTTEGQNYEFCVREKPIAEATEEDVFTILKNKTARYTVITPFRYGAISSRVSDREINRVTDPLELIGIGFQLRDDFLDLSGDPNNKKLTKDWAGDLSEGKRTLILVRTYQAADHSEKRFIDEYIGREGLPLVRKKEIIDIINEYGVLEEVGKLAKNYTNKGLAVLENNLPNTEGTKELLALLEFAGCRNK